jgi:uncharacterized protein YkvS
MCLYVDKVKTEQKRECPSKHLWIFFKAFIRKEGLLNLNVQKLGMQEMPEVVETQEGMVGVIEKLIYRVDKNEARIKSTFRIFFNDYYLEEDSFMNIPVSPQLLEWDFVKLRSLLMCFSFM